MHVFRWKDKIDGPYIYHFKVITLGLGYYPILLCDYCKRFASFSKVLHNNLKCHHCNEFLYEYLGDVFRLKLNESRLKRNQ